MFCNIESAMKKCDVKDSNEAIEEITVTVADLQAIVEDSGLPGGQSGIMVAAMPSIQNRPLHEA